MTILRILCLLALVLVCCLCTVPFSTKLKLLVDTNARLQSLQPRLNGIKGSSVYDIDFTADCCGRTIQMRVGKNFSILYRSRDDQQKTLIDWVLSVREADPIFITEQKDLEYALLEHYEVFIAGYGDVRHYQRVDMLARMHPYAKFLIKDSRQPFTFKLEDYAFGLVNFSSKEVISFNECEVNEDWSQFVRQKFLSTIPRLQHDTPIENGTAIVVLGDSVQSFKAVIDLHLHRRVDNFLYDKLYLWDLNQLDPRKHPATALTNPAFDPYLIVFSQDKFMRRHVSNNFQALNSETIRSVLTVPEKCSSSVNSEQSDVTIITWEFLGQIITNPPDIAANILIGGNQLVDYASQVNQIVEHFIKQQITLMHLDPSFCRIDPVALRNVPFYPAILIVSKASTVTLTLGQFLELLKETTRSENRQKQGQL